MTIYKQPILGKLGIRSGVSGNICFGICCDSKKECNSELQAHVGYYDSLKWRWHTSTWSEKDLKRHQEYLKEKEDLRYRKECIKFVKENKHKLKD